MSMMTERACKAVPSLQAPFCRSVMAAALRACTVSENVRTLQVQTADVHRTETTLVKEAYTVPATA